MASGGAPGGPLSGSDHHNLLLELEETQPTYSSGRPPPLNDDDLMREYEEDHAERVYARASTSYDDFIGGRGGSGGRDAGLPGGPGVPHSRLRHHLVERHRAALRRQHRNGIRFLD